MSKYKQQAETALRLLKAKGQEMDIFRFKLDTYDPLHPDASTPEIEVQGKVVGVNLPASGGTIEAFDNRVLTDPSVRKSFRYFLIAGLNAPFTPEANDVLKTAEGYCRVLGATPLNPDGQQALIYNVGSTLDIHIKFDDSPEPAEQLTV